MAIKMNKKGQVTHVKTNGVYELLEKPVTLEVYFEIYQEGKEV